MKFNGKVSWWFYATIIFVAAVILPIIFVSAFIDTNVFCLIISLSVFTAVEAFAISIALHNYVELQKEELVVVFGFIRKRFPYRDIISLSSTNDPSSSLAASLDRIRIKTKCKSDIMISVYDKEGFFKQMKICNPNIIIM